MSRIHLLIALGICCLSLPSATPASADVLVLKDGSRVETRGAFEVKGRRVLFRDSQGTLAALRLEDVDLDGSRAASQPPPPAAAAPKAAAPQKKAPVLVLTDRDVSHVDPDDIRAVEETPRIVMYTTSWCGYCRKARGVLDQLGVAYDELDIEKSATARLTRDRLAPTCGVPVIDFGGEVVCGFSEERIRGLVTKLEKRKAASAAKAEERDPETEMADGGEG